MGEWHMLDDILGLYGCLSGINAQNYISTTYVTVAS